MEQVSCVLGLMLLTIVSVMFTSTAATAGEAPPTPVHRHTLRQPTPTPSNGCWDGWTENPDTGECYLLVKELMDVDDAHAYCASLAQNDNTPEIISLSTSQEHVFVYEWVKGQVVDGDRLWLGMKNMADNYWLDGTPVGYFNFAPGEPDSYQDGNYCIMMSMASGLWEDAICLVASAFICEMKGTNYVGPIVLPPPAGCPSGWQYRDGYCYYLSNTYLNHDDATKWCAANLATHLTSISNDDENNFILEEALKGGREVWLGLQVDEGGGWSWADHSTLNFTNWYGGHPSSADCVKMVSNNTDAEGTWEGEDCQQNLRYICKMLLNMLGTINSNVTGPWLGLSFDTAMGNWTWADNTVLDFLMWDTNSPYPVEDKSCVKMVNDTAIDYHLRWTNLPCETLSPSICQLYPTHLMGCEDGWLESSGWCYWYSRTESTMANFLDAMWDCQVRGSDLVSINTQEENDFVGSIINNYNYADVWVGLTDNRHDAEMIWTDGAPVTFTNWKALNYADVKYHPMCGYHYKFGTNNEWGLGTCDPRQYYVCKKPFTAIPITPPDTGCRYGDAAYSGSCYTFPTYTHSWDNANRLCKTMNATLAVVNDRAEGAFLSMYLSELGATSWLGLRGTRNSYEWNDRTPFAYVDWEAGQPDSYYGRENCGSASRKTLKLMDSVCSSLMPFVCEAQPGTMVSTLPPPTTVPSVPCEDDPSWLLYDDHCYKIVSGADLHTWGDSHLQCRKDGGELLSVHTLEENAWIESKISSMSSTSFWTGGQALMDSGFGWVDGTPFDFDNWAKGEPNNDMGAEDCVAMYNHRQGYWGDENCGKLMGRVCKRPHGSTLAPQHTTPQPYGRCRMGWVADGSNCLKFFPEEKSFDAARAACQLEGEGADLASIHTPEEQAYVTAAVGELEANVWLGLRGADDLHWVDQTPVTYTNWYPGEPSGQPGKMRCVEAYAMNGQWNDDLCDGFKGYVCKIKKDDSDSDTVKPCSPPYQNYMNYTGACYRSELTRKTWHCYINENFYLKLYVFRKQEQNLLFIF
ncbi:macrophage mannose receptor 1-like 7, partial [Homarus americanus]